MRKCFENEFLSISFTLTIIYWNIFSLLDPLFIFKSKFIRTIFIVLYNLSWFTKNETVYS